MNDQRLLINPDREGIIKASEIIQSGGLVAFPTETVYGLGANALNSDAVRSIFTAKDRPLTDPLIVHVKSVLDSKELLQLSIDELVIFELLTKEFWPGPLTIIAKASNMVPSLVTAETGFVGVRCPNHPLALKLLEESGLPIAAPSANRFGHVSPTKAIHVLNDLACKNVHVLNGEAISHNKDISSKESDNYINCEYGIESTVVKIDNQSKKLVIFRQGAVTQVAIEHILNQASKQGNGNPHIVDWSVESQLRVVNMHQPKAFFGDQNTTNPSVISTTGEQAPGQALTHYAPDVPCMIVMDVVQGSTGQLSEGEAYPVVRLSSTDLSDNTVVIDFGTNSILEQLHDKVLAYRSLSISGNTKEAAHNLFDTLRWSETVSGAKYVLLPGHTFRENSIDINNSNDINSMINDLKLGLTDRMFRAASGTQVVIHTY